MSYLNNICWCFLCVVLNELETATIYVIEVPKPDSKDSNPLGNYDILTEYEDYHNTDKKLEDDLTINHNNVRKDTNTVMCQRLFDTIYGSKHQDSRCLEALDKKKRGNEYIFEIPRGKYFKRPKLVRQDENPFAGFSQDYLDVRDLVRQGFASDYVDVNDFVLRSIPAAVDCKKEVDEAGKIIESCLPISRKTSLSSKDLIGNFNLENNTESSSESDRSSDGKNKDALRKKRKRYKVVSKKDSRSVENNEEQDSDGNYFEKEAGTSYSMQDSSSIEVTTAVTKTIPKKSEKAKYKGPLDNEKYMYIQGNNYYGKGDFRRNGRNNYRREYRLTHFLPKRYHWDEDQVHDLGYFWFNGPKGRYTNYEHM